MPPLKQKKRKRRCFEISIINPKSQSFFQSYGSILPTSLTYIILLTRGCSPWRPAAVMSTTKWENYSLPLIFKDRQERTNIWNTFFFNEKKKKKFRNCFLKEFLLFSKIVISHHTEMEALSKDVKCFADRLALSPVNLLRRPSTKNRLFFPLRNKKSLPFITVFLFEWIKKKSKSKALQQHEKVFFFLRLAKSCPSAKQKNQKTLPLNCYHKA